MKQVLQRLDIGETSVVEIPCPRVAAGNVLIQTSASLVSAGTERMLLDFGKANLLNKARQQPDKVKQVIGKIRTDGLAPTLEAVRSKLDQPVALGYCNVGQVLAVGAGVDGYEVGDRVVSNGKHAEVVCVPKNLCAPIPGGVADGHAAFAVIGAIALQGVRLVSPTLGEAVVVSGLGLVGLMSVQLLVANGCRVLGMDFDGQKLELARRLGAQTVDLSGGEDPLAAAAVFSRGRGVDAVIIAAATKSSEPVSQAATMCRKRGRIVLVGVTGLELSRADFYEKELSFQVSCSYGPGRYDPEYEDKGHDYPFGFVRWTEQRNMEAVLDLMGSGALNPEPLISHRFDIDDAEDAYALLGGGGSALGILLEYPERGEADNKRKLERHVSLHGGGGAAPAGKPSVAFIGAGNYAGQVLIPAFRDAGAHLQTVSSSAGVSGAHFGRKYGFSETTTDTASIFADAMVNTVVIATRHDSHARFVIAGLKAGKHVFVEKPLCLTLGELTEIEQAYTANPGEGNPQSLLMVGFNRRFSPQVKKIKSLLGAVAFPKSFVMTVNAGAIPAEHWTQDPGVGGGRVIGEACHFVDLLRFLAGAPISGFQVSYLGGGGADVRLHDTLSVTLTFEDGSFGVVHYLANGSKSFPKERLEVFAGGAVLQLDNFRRLHGYRWPGFKRLNLRRQDKGQSGCVAAFLEATRTGGFAPISPEEIFEVSRVSIEIAAAGQARAQIQGGRA